MDVLGELWFDRTSSAFNVHLTSEIIMRLPSNHRESASPLDEIVKFVRRHIDPFANHFPIKC